MQKKSLSEFKRNKKIFENRKTTSISLPESYLIFIRENNLSLSAIMKSKIEELMAKSSREDRKNIDDL